MQTNLPAVCVVITYHNEPMDLLEKAICSVDEQAYKGPLEVIVVDDASRTSPNIRKNRRMPVRMIRLEQNVRSARARNVALRAGQADIFTFLDADDVYLPGRIDSHVHFMVDNPGVVFVGGGGMITRFGKTWQYTPSLVKVLGGKECSLEAHILSQRASQEICMEYAFHTCGLSIWSWALEHVGYFNENLGWWGEEWDLQGRLSQIGRVGYVPGPGYHYIARDGSITRKQNPRKQENAANIYRYWRRNVKSLPVSMKRKLLHAEARSLLLASQLYLEQEHDPIRAGRCSCLALTISPSVWAFRSTVRNGLYWLSQLLLNR